MQAALDSTGLILSKDAQNLSAADLGNRINAMFKAQFNRPGSAECLGDATCSTRRQQGSFSLKLTGTATVPTRFATPDRHLADRGFGHRRNRLGHQEAQSGARPRQYRLDGFERQDGGAEDRRPQPAQHAAGRRPRSPTTSRSRSSPSPPTSMSAPATRMSPGSTGSNGKTRTEPARTPITRPRPPATVRARTWTVASHNTWNGCVWDRDQNYDVQNTAPTSAQADQVPRASGRQLPDRDDAALRPTGPPCTARSTR